MKYLTQQTLVLSLLAAAAATTFAQTEVQPPPTTIAPDQTPIDSSRAIGTAPTPAPQGGVDIVGQSATGKQQTTVIDANGNLKMVGPTTGQGQNSVQTEPRTNTGGVDNVPPRGTQPQPSNPNVGNQMVPDSQPPMPGQNMNPSQSVGPMQPVNPGAPSQTAPNPNIVPNTLPPIPGTNPRQQSPNMMQPNPAPVQPDYNNANPQPVSPPQPATPVNPPVGVPNQMPQGLGAQPSAPQPQQMSPATGNSGIVPPTPNQNTAPVQNTPSY